MTTEARPAFYALSPGGWRDYVTLLHAPYTLWHLSYVAIGAGLAPELRPWRLLAALAAFFLAVGVAAHALDELHGRPLRTGIGRGVLVGLAAASLTGAVAIGVAGALAFDLRLLAFVAFGAFIVLAYNLELAGGRFHGDAWFALAWGGFPLLTGYFASAGELGLSALAGAAFATLLSYAQRVLSTEVRRARRHVRAVSGAIVHADGREEPVTRERLIAAPETALRVLSAATVCLAVALPLSHLAS